MSPLVSLLIRPAVCYSQVPPRAFVLRSPLGLSIMPLQRGSFSHLLPLPAARLGCQVPPMVEGWHSRDILLTPFNGWRTMDEATWVLIRGLGYSGLSLPSWLSLSSANLLHREDFFSLHTYGRHCLDSGQGSQLQLTASRCEGMKTQQDVSWWETTFTLWTHVQKLSSHAYPTLHLLAIPNILMRIRSLYEGSMARLVPPAQKLLSHLSQEF